MPSAVWPDQAMERLVPFPSTGFRKDKLHQLIQNRMKSLNHKKIIGCTAVKGGEVPSAGRLETREVKRISNF